MLWTLARLSPSYFTRTSAKEQRAEDGDKEEIIEQPGGTAKRRLGVWAFLVIIAAITFFFGLGNLALIGPDEPRYAEVPREMVATGDYISPQLAGCVWFEKPVLQYWMSAAAYHIFGVNEFSARLPSALAATATVFAIFFAIRRVFSMWAALAVSTVMLTMGILIAFARIVTPDTYLAATMSVSIIFGYLAIEAAGRARLKYWSLCGAFLGLAVLAKGLVGIVLVIAILGLFLLIARERFVSGLRWLLVALLICIIVAAIWYVPVWLRHGSAFVDKFFLEHHFERYLTNRHSHPQPIYFYLLVTLAGTMPWTFFLAPAATRLWSLRPRTSNRDSLLALAWIWFALPLIFFSFSVSKLPGYLLPVFPALAIIIGVEVEQFLRQPNRAHTVAAWCTALLLLAIGIAFVIYSRRLSIESAGLNLLLMAIPTISSLFAISMLVAKKMRVFLIGATAVVVSVIVGTVLMLFPVLNETASLRTLSTRTAAALKPRERIAFFLMKEFAPVFYADGRVVCGVGNGTLLNALHTDKLVEVLQSEPSLVVFTTSNWVEDLESDPRLATEIIATQRNALAIRVTLRE
jgi:4-amino-4-deoxy-L-arabinose transferase-like glycosyltransferase